MSVGSLVVVANARLPTEKAHGHAIVKLCEAFAGLGVSVELWHPRRHQEDPALRDRPVLDHYGVPPVVTVRTLPNIDVVRLERWLPAALHRALLVLHEALWGALVARRAVRRAAALHLTRDVLVAWWLARRGLPTVVDVHVVPSGPRRRVLRRLAGMSAVRGFVALTEGNRAGLLSLGVAPDRVVVSGSAVDVRQYEDLPGRDECREMHDLPLDRPIVGYVGRFQTLGQEKGIPELIRAVGRLRARLDPPPLLLCVGGPMEAVPDHVATAGEVGLHEDDVRFVDHVPAREVPTWIRALDAAVAPFPDTPHMAHNASPLKLLEYRAAGVPIVASDLPAVREALAGGPPARLVPPGDVGALAASIGDLLEGAGTGERQEAPGAAVRSWEERARDVLDLAERGQTGAPARTTSATEPVGSGTDAASGERRPT